MRGAGWMIAGCMALGLGACATEVGPTEEELKARWQAQNVYPENYKNDYLAYMRTYLNNPTGVRGAAVSAPFLKDVGSGDRYVACVRFNARTTEGKYMGPKDGAAVFVSGKLDRFIDNAKVVPDLCRDVALAPFPELERMTR